MLASTIQISNNKPTNPSRQNKHLPFSEGGPSNQSHTHVRGLIPQDPTVCLDPHPCTNAFRFHACKQAVLRTRGDPGSSHSSTIPLVRHHHAHENVCLVSGCVLLRKEVIQPHLPVRLPCYDFVPIASPTFDGSLHKGWATGFGCCRLS